MCLFLQLGEEREGTFALGGLGGLEQASELQSSEQMSLVHWSNSTLAPIPKKPP